MIQRQPSGEAGFAAVDALTALAILTTTLALSIGALSVARRAAAAAAESHSAKGALQLILSGPPRPPGAYSGIQGPFDWSLRIETDSTSSDPIQICRLQAVVLERRSHRRYVYATRRPCPKAGPG